METLRRSILNLLHALGKSRDTFSQHGMPLALACLLAAASPLAAAPRGAVSLPPENLFQIGSLTCGRIANQWIPGRLLRNGQFLSRIQERRNVRARARRQIGSARQALLTRVRTLSRKIREETPLCLPGPTPTVTPTPPEDAVPTVTPTPTPTIALTRINDRLYHTEHSLFIIPEPGAVTWEGSASWDSVYSDSNISNYVSTLRSTFPADYFFIVITAADLLPNRVPNVLTYRRIASGIGQDSLSDASASNICRYHVNSPITDGIYAVLDHEIGHNWGVFIGTELGEGHWHSNSTDAGQMANRYSDDDFDTIKEISGNPTEGFRWTSVNNNTKNETETFSDRDLYLQGLASTFPTLHVLQSPLYNTDGSVSYSSVASYDQSWVESRNGVRDPSYALSEKRFKVGFIYVARDAAEIDSAHRAVERSIQHFVYADAIDTTTFRFQVPFLVTTKFRASVDARLANLDGNTAPILNIDGSPHVTASGGSAHIAFSATDVEDGTPAVSCVPASDTCSVSGSMASVSGLATGAHFFTLRAQDSAGKRSYAHFVVDVP